MKKNITRLILLLILIFIGLHTIKLYHNVKNVLSYRPLVKEVLSENDSPSTEDLILAMIYTETKGQEADLMQSSESSSGVANSIRDSRKSVQQGVRVLSDNLVEAGKRNVDYWAAVQAYNFGSSYIDYVTNHGGKNTVSLAKQYSRLVVAPSLGNNSGKTYRYYHPIALLYGGGKLYRNGGNIYYAKQVQFNLLVIKLIAIL